MFEGRRLRVSCGALFCLARVEAVKAPARRAVVVGSGPMHGCGLKQQHVAGAHRRLNQVGMIREVVRLMGLQVGKFCLTSVRALKKMDAAVISIGIVQGDPDDPAVDRIDMRMADFRELGIKTFGGVFGEETRRRRNGPGAKEFLQ